MFTTLGELSFSGSVWAVPYLIMTLMTAGIAVVAWSYRGRQGAIGLFYDQIGLTVTAVVLMLMLTVTDPAAKAFFWKLMFVPLFLASVAWTHMALDYSDSKYLINRYTTSLSIGTGFVFLGIIFTPETSQYFLADWKMVAGTLQIEVGLLCWVFIFSWVAPHFAIGAVQLGRLFYKGSGFGPQLILLIGGISIVFGAHLLYPLQLVPIEIGPLGSLVKTIFFLAAIFWFGMFDVAPVAREKLVENMDDPVLVINENDRIADINPAAKQLIGANRNAQLTGEEITNIVGDQGDVLLDYLQSADQNLDGNRNDDGVLVQDEVAVPVDGETQYYDLVISSLLSRSGEARGRLVVLRDISELQRRERELREAQQRAEELLLNILPEEIVSELDETGDYVADTFQEATVLFADIVNFTSYAHGQPAKDIVKVLDGMFSRFDRIVNEMGLEKIKTIGDEYFVASGVPESREDHASAAAELALRLREEVEHFNRDSGESFQLRIGINSGPMVGGIIGEDKFVYDVWGHTVNMGSRMESYGKPGKIHVTLATKKAIEKHAPGRFSFEERSPINVKGKGELTTYFLEV